MNVYRVDPLDDQRWGGLVARHRRASIFHTAGWLRALERTYRFRPIAFTTSPPTHQLENALVLCQVRSWVTGNRLVSLPFSDHCDPLVENADELRALCVGVERYRGEGRWKYAELRPVGSDAAPPEPFRPSHTYYLHRVDLRPSTDALLKGFHHDSIQRRIRHAERERLEYEEGRGEALVRKLYHLLGLTRERHGVPLQPPAWFRNLVDCVGERLCVRVASKDGEPVAGILTLTHGTTIVYKYGGSDPRHNRLGGTPFLFWKAIEEGKRAGAEELDLGRTDCDNTGLIVFKERWSARRSTLTYWRSPLGRAPGSHAAALEIARRGFARLPAGVRKVGARLVYRHLA